MDQHESQWADDRPVPSYVQTGGRTDAGSARMLTMTSLIKTAAAPAADPTRYRAVLLAILRRCDDWITVSEVAAYTNTPLGVTKVLLGELLDAGLLVVSARTTTQAPPPDAATLRQVLSHLRAL